MIEYRSLDRREVYKIQEIDRSEHVTLGYRFQDGLLEAEDVNWQVPRWTVHGKADFDITERIKDLQRKIERGERVLGAFDEDLLVGYAVFREKLSDDMAQLADLFTSREYRRRGIASHLVYEIIDMAKASGVRRLYVSAVPSESAVGFYLKLGFIPTLDIHPELFELEPEDIHMILDL